MIDFTIGPKIDLGGNNSCRILTWDSGGCRPAHKTEIALWAENESIRAELEAVKAERDGWRDASFLSDCEARSGQLEEMTVRAESAEARVTQLEAENGRLRSVLEPFTYPGATVAGQIGRPEISSVRAARNALTGREG